MVTTLEEKEKHSTYNQTQNTINLHKSNAGQIYQEVQSWLLVERAH